MENIDNELLLAYCDEATDLLINWESVCLELNKNITNELYQELFRIAHNMKGGSRAVGLTEYGNLVHHVEDGITLLRDGKVSATSKIISALLEAQNILLDWTTQLKTNSSYNVDFKEFIARYESLFKEDNTVANEPKDELAALDFSAPIDFDNLELGDKKPELIAAEKAPENSKVQEEKVVTPAANKKKPAGAARNSNANETIRISAQKLDQLLQAIGELSIHQSIVWHTKGPEISNNKVFLNSIQLSQKLTKELYDKTLSLRMQPLHSVFQRLERNIIDLSVALDKKVDVIIQGSDVELDKMVIEKIIDPLTHIVRNAIDHGIENREKRSETTKPEKGTIQISAHQDTFGVVITVKDDGKGLVAEKILKKAIEKGLINANQNPNPKEIYNFILLPGFSTADKITDVSGRGVGLDVVSKSLEELHGTLSTDSEEGKGTTFTITLPTSMSIIEGMILQISGQNYVVPVGAVEEVISTQETNLNINKNMFNLRNHVIAIYNINEALRQAKKTETKDDKKALMICRSGNERIAFYIDRVIGQQQIVIRTLNENINDSFGLMGGTILGNGEPGLIIDVPELVEYFISKVKPKEEVA